MLALVAACLDLAWNTRVGPLHDQLYLLLDAAEAAGLNPATANDDTLRQLAADAYGWTGFYRYINADQWMRVILFYGAFLCALNTRLQWPDLFHKRLGLLTRTSPLVWALLTVTYINGALDVGEEVEVFGGDDIKHVAYIALALGLGGWLLLRYRRPALLVPYLISFAIHVEYILSEVLETWASSLFATAVEAALGVLMDPRIAAVPELVDRGAQFDSENLFNKNWISAGYVLTFALVYLRLRPAPTLRATGDQTDSG